MGATITTRLSEALEKYKNGEITLGKAAELAKKDLREMMIIATKQKIPFQYSVKELEEDHKLVNHLENYN